MFVVLPSVLDINFGNVTEYAQKSKNLQHAHHSRHRKLGATISTRIREKLMAARRSSFYYRSPYEIRYRFSNPHPRMSRTRLIQYEYARHSRNYTSIPLLGLPRFLRTYNNPDVQPLHKIRTIKEITRARRELFGGYAFVVYSQS